MYVNTDLGTSGVKAVLLNEQGEVMASHAEKLTVSRSHPLWSEQDPEQWWLATDTAMKALGAQHSLRDVKALGMAGQMHGTTLLDKSLQVLRLAVLWNDGRCAEECQLLGERVNASRQITGNLMMPGFTAPELLWAQRHETAMFNQVDRVLLPRDYLHLRMTGEFADDVSDAVGTVWLDIARRDWSDGMLTACDLSRGTMPALFEGSDVTGQLRPGVTQAWNMPQALVVDGGGDNVAGAVGVGMANTGQAMLSLDISGVYFAIGEGFLSKSESMVHGFCHALPGRWHLMSVTLSVVSYLNWVTKLTGLASMPTLIATTQTVNEGAGPAWLLPCLSGERTSYNNPRARSIFFDLTHQHGPAELARVVLEGVDYALADSVDMVYACGIRSQSITLIGDGARSTYWRQMLTDTSGQQFDYRTGGDVDPALGAARLAQLAVHDEADRAGLLKPLPLERAYHPDGRRAAHYTPQRKALHQIYQ